MRVLPAMVIGSLLTTSAQATWGFRYEFSTDGGFSWGNNRVINVASDSQQVRFRVVAYVDPGTVITANGETGLAVAFGRLTAQEKLTNFAQGASGDSIAVSTFGEINGGNGQYNSNSSSGGTTFLGTASPLSIAQQTTTPLQLTLYCPSSGQTPKLEWIVRLGIMTVGRFTPEAQNRTIQFSNVMRTQSQWYRDVVDSFSGLPDTNRADPTGTSTDFTGTLIVVPAPGCIGLAALCLLGSTRRVRK